MLASEASGNKLPYRERLVNNARHRLNQSLAGEHRSVKGAGFANHL